jgi:hypothetical protein
MSWKQDSTGKWTWTADGKGNPNKKGDNKTPSKDTFNVTLPTIGGGSSISSVDLAGATFDTTGLGLPASVTSTFANPSQVGGTDLYQALVKTATSHPEAWIPLKYALYQSYFYGTNTPTFTPGFSSQDKSAVTDFLTTLTINNTNTPKGVKPTPVITFLSQQQQLASLYGGAAAQTQVKQVSVPSTPDLVQIADNAFRAATGLPPTSKQAKEFARSYQQQVMASARASVAQPKITTPKIPQTPMGTTPVTPEENLAAVQGAMTKGSAAPKTILQQVTQPPDATVAAQEFARKQNPAAAGSMNIDNALNAMFTSLARNSQ